MGNCMGSPAAAGSARQQEARKEAYAVPSPTEVCPDAKGALVGSCCCPRAGRLLDAGEC